jgi:predicted Zn-dependent protease with MMP-like domain
MKRAEFENLVARALDELPEEFAEALDNVAIVIEDQPTRAQLSDHHLGEDHTLLGLYEGVPLTERSHQYGFVLPDKITVFQKPIEDVCDTEDEVVEVVRDVVLHEIAHHFGISDERLDEIEREGGTHEH